MENEYYPFRNLPLPYDYDALEPYIDEKTMMLHHDRHLQTYINKLNDTLEQNPHLQKLSLEQLVQTSPRLGGKLRNEVRNNAGGVYNHRFYFSLLANPAPRRPYGKLLEAIERDFGSFERFKAEFKEAALSVFGSGYAWLTVSKSGLKIVTTPNQNTPLERGMRPVLTIDVWEHAYYLKHYNERASYIDDWFKVVNWPAAEKYYNYGF